LNTKGEIMEKQKPIDDLVDSYNRDSSCERFTDEELNDLMTVMGEMEPIVYEIEARNNGVYFEEEVYFEEIEGSFRFKLSSEAFEFALDNNLTFLSMKRVIR